MYNTVRGAGFNNLVIIGGNYAAYDLSQTPSYPINGTNIVYATHVYQGNPDQALCNYDCAFGNLAKTAPIIATEFGEYDCGSSYVIPALNYFDAPEGIASNKMSWTAWAWNAPNSCSFPSIISDWTGDADTMGTPIKSRMLSYLPPPPPNPPTGLTATVQ